MWDKQGLQLATYSPLDRLINITLPLIRHAGNLGFYNDGDQVDMLAYTQLMS